MPDALFSLPDKASICALCSSPHRDRTVWLYCVRSGPRSGHACRTTRALNLTTQWRICFAACMAVRQLLWDGFIPVELQIEGSELAALNNPQPHYVSHRFSRGAFFGNLVLM